jgi:hypothetical protein
VSPATIHVSLVTQFFANDSYVASDLVFADDLSFHFHYIIYLVIHFYMYLNQILGCGKKDGEFC